MNKLENEKIIHKILGSSASANSGSNSAGWWIEEEEKYGFPALQVIVFIRECWRAVVGSSPAQFDQFFQRLTKRSFDNDSPESISLREQSKVLSKIFTDPASKSAVSALVRAAQVSSVIEILGLIENAETFEDGVSANWELVVRSPEKIQEFGNIIEHFVKFDPALK